MNHLATLLRCAADALDIAADWNIADVQVNPPPEWNLRAVNEDAANGWCSTHALAEELRKAADRVIADASAKVPRS